MSMDISVVSNTYISINSYLKCQWTECSNQKTQNGRLNEKKQGPTNAAYKRPTFGQRTHRFKVTGWEKIFHANRNDKKAGVTILLSDKIDFKAKTIKKD